MPYVFTNPRKDTELFSCDKVFVLSQTSPHKGPKKDILEETHHIERVRAGQKKTQNDLYLYANGIQKSVADHHNRLDNINKKIGEIYTSIESSDVRTVGAMDDLKEFVSTLKTKRNKGVIHGRTEPLKPSSRPQRMSKFGGKPTKTSTNLFSSDFSTVALAEVESRKLNH